MRGIAIRLAVIGIIVLAGFALRDRLTGAASDLQVGDCFQVPADLSRPISEVQRSPCNEGHTAEVVFVGNYGDASAYPTDAQWLAFVEGQCVPAFNSYTGLDFATDPTYDMGYFTPTLEGWNGGDREVTCYASRLDGEPMTQSVKKAQ